MDTKSLLKSSVAAAALMAAATPALAQEQTTMTNMQAGVKVNMYGQVNKAVLWVDDGNTSRTAIVDNDQSSSRFGIIATAPITDQFSFGAQIEYEFQSNDSNNITLNGGNGDFNFGQGNFCERIAQVTMSHKQFGTVSLGQGPTASDGTTEVDLSNTGTLGGGGLSTTLLGALRFSQETAGTVGDQQNGPNVNTVFNNLDGMSRQDRIRYDTPTIMGFALGGSYVSGGAADVALRYGNKFGAFQVAAAASFWNFAGTNTSNEDGWGGSASVLHDSGINATIFGARQYRKKCENNPNQALCGSGDQPDPWTVGGKIGYIAKIFNVGPTAFAVDYSVYNDFIRGTGVAASPNKAEGDSWGVQAVQHFSKTGTEAYLTWRRWALDTSSNATTIDYNDVNAVMAGVRVKF